MLLKLSVNVRFCAFPSYKEHCDLNIYKQSIQYFNETELTNTFVLASTEESTPSIFMVSYNKILCTVPVCLYTKRGLFPWISLSRPWLVLKEWFTSLNIIIATYISYRLWQVILDFVSFLLHSKKIEQKLILEVSTQSSSQACIKADRHPQGLL